MSRITFTDKEIGDQLTHEDINELKASINAIYDSISVKSALKYKTITLTPTQILNNTLVNIIPNVGADRQIMLVSVNVYLKFNATTYDGNSNIRLYNENFENILQYYISINNSDFLYSELFSAQQGNDYILTQLDVQSVGTITEGDSPVDIIVSYMVYNTVTKEIEI